MKYLYFAFILISLLFSSCSSSKKTVSESNYDYLIGKTYIDYDDIGHFDYLSGYLLDPTSSDYKMIGFRLSDKTILILFSKNIGDKNGRIVWQILDYVVGPKKAYFDHWCCKILDTDKFDRESFAFINYSLFSKKENFLLYRANRKEEKIIEIDIIECNDRSFLKGRMIN
ncbi:MAG: hypothetical protein ABFS38_03405 [Bacteroidota bacterium]